MQFDPEVIEMAVNNLLEKGDLPNPEHYPAVVKKMVLCELYDIARKSEEKKNGI